MQFRTPIPVLKSKNPIGYNSKIVSLGSCFAVNMAEKFDYFQFRNTVNPFGILFHPLALERFILFAVQEKVFTDADVFFHNGRWHCFDAHSEISHTDKNQLLANLDALVATANQHLAEATHLIITLGTAWVYRFSKTEAIVANCHKVPQKEFVKELLSPETVRESILSIVTLLRKANPGLQFLFTVSPVRHSKDGFVENQWSKANLISGLHQALAQNSENASYFPSYEILMDELRDYRFYAEDLLHPSRMAIDYIWERFVETQVCETAYPLLEEVAQIRKALAHRPFNAESEAHTAFLSNVHRRIETLTKKYPFITF